MVDLHTYAVIHEVRRSFMCSVVLLTSFSCISFPSPTHYMDSLAMLHKLCYPVL